MQRIETRLNIITKLNLHLILVRPAAIRTILLVHIFGAVYAALHHEGRYLKLGVVVAI